MKLFVTIKMSNCLLSTKTHTGECVACGNHVIVDAGFYRFILPLDVFITFGLPTRTLKQNDIIKQLCDFFHNNVLQLSAYHDRFP